MKTRVVLTYDDAPFIERRSTLPRAEGHEVVSAEPAFAVPTRSDVIEFTMTQATGTSPGVRIGLTGSSSGALNPEGIATLLPEPATPRVVVQALCRFGFHDAAASELSPMVPCAPIRNAQDELLASLPKLKAFANSLCGRSGGGTARAEDLVQETVLKALTHMESFVPGSNMTAWLRKILRNEFYAEYRKRRRETQDEDGFHAARLRTLPTQEGHLRFQEFRAAMDRLKPKHREALILVCADGLSNEEAAAICACAIGTIKSRVSRARTTLAVFLDAPETDREPTDGCLTGVPGKHRNLSRRVRQ
jgi:RNA polymerase sigma-70 factor (ECF subfamily)